jgi:hypothetical protein
MTHTIRHLDKSEDAIEVCVQTFLDDGSVKCERSVVTAFSEIDKADTELLQLFEELFAEL